MTQTILTLAIYIVLFSCSVKESERTNTTVEEIKPSIPITLLTEKHPDKNFSLIEDFENNKNIFSSDTFELYDQSSDGGQLIAFHTKEKDYLVLDIWLYGETGKIHSTYWTDRKLNFKIIKRTDFVYDKPYYENGFKITEKTEFYSYSDNFFIIYNSDKQEINVSDIQETEKKLKNFFVEITKDIELIK